MMVGHAALAFAIVGFISYHYFNYNKEKALMVAVISGLFAFVPDFDIGYAFIGLIETGVTDITKLQEAFWAYSHEVHRGITHSLIIGTVSGFSFGLLSSKKRNRIVLGVLILLTIVALSFFYNGSLQGAIMISFVLAGTTMSIIARHLRVNELTVTIVALVGLLSHPFGDMFTGTTPVIFYPIDIRLLPDIFLFSQDPTLHLLGAFLFELSVIWLAILVYLYICESSVSQYIHKRSFVGVSYASAVFVITPPTLSLSYHFVFTVIIFAIVGLFVDLPIPNFRSGHTRRTILLTGLSTITIAVLSYTLAYLLV